MGTRISDDYCGCFDPVSEPINFIQYERGGVRRWVRSSLKDKQHDYCLCNFCAWFYPGTQQNCKIAERLYKLEVQDGLVTPVWECPVFTEK